MRHVARIKKKPKLNSFTNINKLLHSIIKGKSTYFYKQRWFLYSIPFASTLALLLVMGLCINPVGGLSGGNSSDSEKVYAADNIPEEPGYDDIVPETGVALRIDTTLNDKDTIEEQVSGTGTQYIKVDFTVGANNIQNYDVYVQADSTALTGQSHGDRLQSITTNSTGTVGTKEWGYGVSRGDVDPSTMTYKPIQTSVSTSADSQDAGEGKTLTGISQPYTLAFAANLEGAASDHYKSNITLSVAAGATETVLGFGRLLKATTMQEMFSAVCDGARIGDEGKLEDERDGKVYWVAKLKDGNCWMTQNLSIIDKTINSTDSDIETGEFTIPPSSISNYTSATQNQPKAYYHTTYGGYYNWYTATAGYGNYSITTDGANVEHSICPKGWRLPTSGNNTTSDLYYLTNGLTVAQMTTAPYRFVYSGWINTDSLISTDSSGYYWSSTAGNDTSHVYNLDFNASSIKPSSSSYRYRGFPIRCIAR